MRRGLIFAYGAICYVIFLVTFVYAIGFIGNFVVPRGLDGPTTGSLWDAFLVNLTLLTAFALQHSVLDLDR